MKISQAAQEFLALRRIAVTGVSRTPESHGGNVVYRRLRECGYQVAAINPAAEVVEDDPAYPTLAAVPGGVEAVVIATRPDRALATMQEAADLGIRYVWMHRGPGAGSVDEAATTFGRAHGIVVIDGGCPLMFGPTADSSHRTMCRVLQVFGQVPRRVE